MLLFTGLIPILSITMRYRALIDEAFLNQGSVYALSSSLNEVYYILHRHYMEESEARESLRDIAETFDLVDLTGLFVFESIDSDEPDYEDGLIRVAAEELQVDAIISYDKAAFKSSFVPQDDSPRGLGVPFQERLRPKKNRKRPPKA